MKIVLDTNVLVAGLLSPFGSCGEIIRMVSSGKLRLGLDARILSEYNEVLHRPKFGFEKDNMAALLDYIALRKEQKRTKDR
ncbi:MAG: putative toxin-antitoxin system toxin component, PIN family [Syntrophales bacterium LBB04]|nr:putative toxin-antitoxin system toxin component, PIN family [Syntrophales bacterium LBB04]